VVRVKVVGSLKKFYHYAFPMQAVLITCKNKEKTNIVTVAWHTPVSLKPPLYGISLSSRRYSFEIIKESKEFAINFAPIEIVDKIHYCGTHSGRLGDKVKEAGLSLIPAKKISVPLIDECYAHLECKLRETIELGDHFFVVGEVVSAIINEDAFEKDLLKVDKIKPTYYLGDSIYITLDEKTIKRF
jgi:flavin reductase (DIM6/NTAB) family NADH-FMN oxidoreductase RutF